jgi:hypothetical protein
VVLYQGEAGGASSRGRTNSTVCQSLLGVRARRGGGANRFFAVFDSFSEGSLFISPTSNSDVCVAKSRTVDWLLN